MKTMDEEPWNIIVEPPLGNCKKRQLMPLEGSWKLIGNENFEAYLLAIGISPLTATMVLRSDFMVTMYEDLDKQWKILSETCVKAKSIRGYKTNSFKMTANKFQLGIAKPELLEDWDPRLVVTTVTLEPDEDGQCSKMFLEQIAEKDCKYCNDSSVTWEANGDFLTMSLEVFSPHDPTVSVKAVRKFMRHKPGDKRNGSRKMSAPF